MDTSVDTTRRLQDTDDASLENFFRRPVKIAEEEWGTGTQLAFDINPWQLFWENPRVAARINNFNLLRCKMRVKVIINGNGFHFGRALVSYLPYAQYDFLSSNAALIRQDLVQASQQPHIFLNPTTSMGGEMTLPFFCASNYMNIPFQTWREMGQLFFRSLNTLKHANGAADQVTISVFAWAEDVNFNVLTDFTPQSGNEIDQANAKGVISGPATSIAKYAAYFKGIPYIGPFATATNMAAGTVSAVAKIFGYCRPVVTKACEPYRPTPVSSLALTNVPDTTQKLTVDDKQELSIDPRISGLGGVDPLNIQEIAKRESYLTTFIWSIGTSPETLLWNSRVDPVLWAESGGGGSVTAYHLPACAVAAIPFQYWTGTVKFRFQIVASSFHKGRIKIVYDPNALNPTADYNVHYLRIVDIAEEQDFTVEVGVGQYTTLLQHALPGQDSLRYSSSVPVSRNKFDNGALGVFIVNELTTPNSTVDNDIEINVYVSTGDDFEVFVPDDSPGNYTFKPFEEFVVQSGTEVPESFGTSEPDKPQQAESLQVGMGVQDTSKINQVFTGEAIASFRTILKRYNLHSCIGTYYGDNYIAWGKRPWFPFLRGAVPGAVHTTSSAQPYNYCNTVMLHWVANCFSGMRGSIRYKLLPRFNIAPENVLYTRRAPFVDGEIAYRDSFMSTPVYNTGSEMAASAVQKDAIGTASVPANDRPFTGTTGSAYTHGQVNGVLEFEMPYYSLLRFTPGKAADWTSQQTYNETWDYFFALHRASGDSDLTHLYDLYCAAGEDFQCFFWTGMPRVYYEYNPPAPEPAP